MTKYFICNSNGFKSMYQVVNEGSKVNSDCTRCVIVPMIHDANGELVAKPNATRLVVVFSKLKGVSPIVSDDDIWEVMGLLHASISEKNKRMKDFLEHRKYFDDPNNADVPTWHIAGENVMTHKIWTPCDHIPSDLK